MIAVTDEASTIDADVEADAEAATGGCTQTPTPIPVEYLFGNDHHRQLDPFFSRLKASVGDVLVSIIATDSIRQSRRR